MFYTYMHTRNDTGEIFYVGKGKKRRPHDKSNRNRYWWNVVNKAGYTVHILGTWKDEDDALDHEVFLLKVFREMGFKMVNVVEGGRGATGYRHTEEARKKMSEFRTGRPTYKGYKPTEEHRRNQSLAQRGRKHPPETIEKMRKAHSGPNNAMWGRPNLGKRRAVICTSTGQRFDSLTLAAEVTGADSAKITLVCQGKRKSTKGLNFKYDES